MVQENTTQHYITLPTGSKQKVMLLCSCVFCESGQ